MEPRVKSIVVWSVGTVFQASVVLTDNRSDTGRDGNRYAAVVRATLRALDVNHGEPPNEVWTFSPENWQLTGPDGERKSVGPAEEADLAQKVVSAFHPRIAVNVNVL